MHHTCKTLTGAYLLVYDYLIYYTAYSCTLANQRLNQSSLPSVEA